MSVTPYQQGAGNLLDLDRQGYNEVLDLQHRLVSLRARNQIPDTLIMVEHPHTFTVGKAVPDEVPTQIDGVPVVRIERGGQWTYHGPGQLVGYPILDLNTRERDIHRFLWSMEETLMRTLEEFDIIGDRVEGKGKTGVWIGTKKIASIGAAVRNWITFHGFALNVNTDMHYFDLIDPCGMPSSTMTSMKTIIGVHVDLDKVKNSVKRNFEDVFHVSLRTIDAQMLDQRLTMNS